MSSETTKKSLVDQIIEETIKKLEKQKVFEKKNIILLKEMANSGRLTNSKSIINAIKSKSGESIEAS